MLGALLATALCMAALPLVIAELGPTALCLTCFLMGVAQGPTFPTNNVLLSRWVPQVEKGAAAAVSNLSDPLAGAISSFAVPALAVALGWRAACYCFAAATVAFLVAWQVLVSDEPASCHWMSAEETFFLTEQGLLVPQNGKSPAKSEADRGNSGGKRAAVPMHVFRHPAIIATFFAHSAFNLLRYFIYQWMPTFYSETFGADPETIGRHLIMPEIASFVAGVLVTPLGDRLVEQGRLTLRGCRVVFSTGAFIGSGLALMLVAVAPQPWVITAALSLVQAMLCLHGLAFKVSYIELTNQYSGLVSGVGNTLATFASFAGPLLTASVLERYHSWPLMFAIMFLFNVFAAVVYGSLISTRCVDHVNEDIEPKKEK